MVAFDDSFNSNSISAYISTDLNNDFQTLFNNAGNTGSRQFIYQTLPISLLR